ncbi:MAG: hypothetical protein ACLUCZ_02490 [Thomasclavelia ramosa]|uniref:hypothetical protein n=1 Tax=Thomasclavelia ramosa TaxID=1547 RepID=UPI0036F3B9CB
MIALKLKNDLLVPQEKDKNGLKRIIKINKGTVYKFYDDLNRHCGFNKPVLLAKKCAQKNEEVCSYYGILKLPYEEVKKNFETIIRNEEEG